MKKSIINIFVIIFVLIFGIGIGTYSSRHENSPIVSENYAATETIQEVVIADYESYEENDGMVSEELSPQSFSYYMSQVKGWTGIEELDNMALIYIAEGVIAPCPPNPDGPCGINIEIFGPKDWTVESKGNYTFYLKSESGTGTRYYGPFTDDLSRIIDEAKEASANALALGEGGTN